MDIITLEADDITILAVELLAGRCNDLAEILVKCNDEVLINNLNAFVVVFIHEV